MARFESITNRASTRPGSLVDDLVADEESLELLRKQLSQVHQLRTELERRDGTIAELREQVSELAPWKQHCTMLRRQISSLDERVEAAEASGTQTKTQLAQRLRVAEGATKDLTAHATRLEREKVEVQRAADTRMAALEKELVVCAKERQEQAREIKRLHAETGALREAAGVRAGRDKDSVSEVEGVRTQLAKARKDRLAAEEKASKLQHRADEQAAATETSAKATAALDARVAELSRQLGSAKDRLGQAARKAKASDEQSREAEAQADERARKLQTALDGAQRALHAKASALAAESELTTSARAACSKLQLQLDDEQARAREASERGSRMAEELRACEAERALASRDASSGAAALAALVSSGCEQLQRSAAACAPLLEAALAAAAAEGEAEARARGPHGAERAPGSGAQPEWAGEGAGAGAGAGAGPGAALSALRSAAQLAAGAGAGSAPNGATPPPAVHAQVEASLLGLLGSHESLRALALAAAARLGQQAKVARLARSEAGSARAGAEAASAASARSLSALRASLASAEASARQTGERSAELAASEAEARQQAAVAAEQLALARTALRSVRLALADADVGADAQTREAVARAEVSALLGSERAPGSAAAAAASAQGVLALAELTTAVAVRIARALADARARAESSELAASEARALLAARSSEFESALGSALLAERDAHAAAAAEARTRERALVGRASRAETESAALRSSLSDAERSQAAQGAGAGADRADATALAHALLACRARAAELVAQRAHALAHAQGYARAGSELAALARALASSGEQTQAPPAGRQAAAAAANVRGQSARAALRTSALTVLAALRLSRLRARADGGASAPTPARILEALSRHAPGPARPAPGSHAAPSASSPSLARLLALGARAPPRSGAGLHTAEGLARCVGLVRRATLGIATALRASEAERASLTQAALSASQAEVSATSRAASLSSALAHADASVAAVEGRVRELQQRQTSAVPADKFSAALARLEEALAEGRRLGEQLRLSAAHTSAARSDESRARAEAGALQAELRQQEETASRLGSAAASRGAEAEAMRAGAARSAEEHAALAQRLTDCLAALGAAREEAEGWQRDATDARAVIAASAEQQSRASALSERMRRQADGADLLRAQAQSRLAALEVSLDVRGQQLAASQRMVGSLHGAHAALEAQLERLDEQTEDARAEAQRLRTLHADPPLLSPLHEGEGGQGRAQLELARRKLLGQPARTADGRSAKQPPPAHAAEQRSARAHARSLDAASAVRPLPGASRASTATARGALGAAAPARSAAEGQTDLARWATLTAVSAGTGRWDDGELGVGMDDGDDLMPLPYFDPP